MGDDIRVVLATDQTMLREGLSQTLTSYGCLHVVGQTDNGCEAVALVKETQPDVLVMQVQLPFKKVRDNLEEIRKESPSTKVVLITTFESHHFVREFTGLGVSAYLLRSSSVAQLVAAIRTAKLTPNDRSVVFEMPRDTLGEINADSEDVLSAREMEVLLLAARGLSNQQICASLHVAEATVKRHLANVYQKMQVHSRSEAVSRALSKSWITIEDVTREAAQG